VRFVPPIDRLDDPALSERLELIASSAQAAVEGVAVPTSRQRQRTQRLRRAVAASVAAAGCVIALVVAVVLVGLTASNPTTRSFQSVLDINPRVNLGIVSAQTQLTVNLAHGYVRGAVSPAPLGVGPPIALARSGYVIGQGMGGSYVSVSLNLRHIIHQWSASDGRYPAPANNPKDIWLTQFTGSASSAAEYDGVGTPVGAPLTIPTGSIVVGQSRSNLLIEQSPTNQVLELWNPTSRSVVASLGGWDQVATTSSLITWASGNALHIDTSDGTPERTVPGPANAWATSVAISSNGRIAVIWEPRPGSAGARSRRSVADGSSLAVVDLQTGSSITVPGSVGATGPVAWTPDGSRVFFGQSPEGRSAGVATYLLSARRAQRIELPGVSIPEDFGPSTGSLYVWNGG
jgi:hypothetical protein